MSNVVVPRCQLKLRPSKERKGFEMKTEKKQTPLNS